MKLAAGGRRPHSPTYDPVGSGVAESQDVAEAWYGVGIHLYITDRMPDDWWSHIESFSGRGSRTRAGN